MDSDLPTSISKEEFLEVQLLQEKVNHAETSLSLATSEYNVKVMEMKYFLAKLYRKYNIGDDKIISDNGIIVDKA